MGCCKHCSEPWVSQNVGNFVTSCITVNFSGGFHLHGVALLVGWFVPNMKMCHSDTVFCLHPSNIAEVSIKETVCRLYHCC